MEKGKKKNPVFTKANLKHGATKLGAVGAGIILSHAANSFIPRMENKAADIAIPFGIGGAAFVGSIALSKHPFLCIGLAAVAAASTLTGVRRAVDHFGAAGEDGMPRIPETAQSIINKVLPLGCTQDRAMLGNPDTGIDLDAGTETVVDELPLPSLAGDEFLIKMA